MIDQLNASKYVVVLGSPPFLRDRIVQVSGAIDGETFWATGRQPYQNLEPTYPLSQCFDTLAEAKLFLLERRLIELDKAKTALKSAECDVSYAETRLAYARITIQDCCGQ